MHSLYLIESLCSENYTFGIILSCSSRYTFLIQLKSAPPRHWFLCLFWLLKWVLSGNRTLSSVVVVQSLSCIWLCNPTDIAHQASLSFTVSWSLLKLMSVESVMPSNHLIVCHPLLLPPSIFPSIRVFSNELVHIEWPKYWSISFNISPYNEYSGLISFRIDWFDLLAVQGTLSLKPSIRHYLAFIMVQLSHLYMTTGKTIALTICTFVGKLMCLFFSIYCLGLS